MTKTFPITRSKVFSGKMDQFVPAEEGSPRDEWPMASYMESWKLFRGMSDENEVTARHVVSRNAWPKAQGLQILDVGSGNGHLVRQIAVTCQNQVSAIHLLDPDKELLEEAEQNVSDSAIAHRVETYLCRAEEGVPQVYTEIDAILAIHVVYLMEKHEVELLLRSLPIGVPIFVVLDKPQSVFSRLWEITAPKYYKRSIQAHEIISSLPAQFDLDVSVISSHLRNPLAEKDEIKNSVLSLLCYTDVRDLEEADWLALESIVSEGVHDGILTCDSSCYQIVRNG